MSGVPTKILIVEDELIVQMHLTRIVTDLGHEAIGAASNRREALALAERERPDLVLMDIQLAGNDDGVDAAQELTDRFGCAVVFVTANGDVETMRRAAPVAAAGYLVKPFSNADVFAALTTAIAGHGRLRQLQARERSLVSALSAGGTATSVPHRRTAIDERVRRPRRPFGSGTRLLVYSHDTFGLGHLRRSLNLIRGLHERFEDLSVLLVTGSPMVHRHPMPEGTDYLKLPAVRKVGNERYEARSLSISDVGIHKLRSNLILRAVRDYDPNALLVDHSPTGMKDELRPALEWLARNGSCVRMLGLRDTIDRSETVIPDWRRRGVFDVLQELYDHLLIYGSRAVYDPVREYEFPDELAAKTTFVNYVCNDSVESSSETGASDTDGKPIVAVSVGGGDGGAEAVIGSFLRMLREFRSRIDFHAQILTGPFLDADLRLRFEKEARDLPATLMGYVPSTAELYRRAELVVCTAGYNTATDLLAHARRAILIPRVLHREEQLLRARRFDELGLVTCLAPSEVTPARLFEAIAAERARGERLTAARRERRIPLDGVERFAAFCAGLDVAAD